MKHFAYVRAFTYVSADELRSAQFPILSCPAIRRDAGRQAGSEARKADGPADGWGRLYRNTRKLVSQVRANAQSSGVYRSAIRKKGAARSLAGLPACIHWL